MDQTLSFEHFQPLSTSKIQFPEGQESFKFVQREHSLPQEPYEGVHLEPIAHLTWYQWCR